jgi:hypothetical protein
MKKASNAAYYAAWGTTSMQSVKGMKAWYQQTYDARHAQDSTPKQLYVGWYNQPRIPIILSLNNRNYK